MLLLLKLFAALIILGTAILGGLIAKRAPAYTNYADALAGGIFLGASGFHLLPDAIGAFSGAHFTTPLLLAVLLTLVSCLLLVIFDAIAYRLHGGELRVCAYMLTLTLSIHATLAGISFGLSATVGTLLLLFVAIIAHKGSASFALAKLLQRSCLGDGRWQQLFMLFALTTPMGILLGAVLAPELAPYTGITGYFNAIAAGTFLYIPLIHLRKYLLTGSRVESLKNFSALLVGMSVMAGLAIVM